MILYAGWALLLSRLSAQEDVVIGTPVANRQRLEWEGLIGVFVNSLVLRVSARGDLELREYLQQIKAVTLGAYDHQDLPFEQLVEALQPERSLNRNPIFQVMLVLQNAQRIELRVPGLTVATENPVDEPAMVDLLLWLEERGDEIAGNLSYAADLFDRKTVSRWMACFEVLLQSMADEVASRIGALPILPQTERCQIVEEFNATGVAYPRERLIHELFEEQVERTGDAVAVSHERQQLSYAQLNEQANQLAVYLRERGVGPDQLVGICMPRSPAMVVGLLGVLKAGGAYVPVDPSYPAERIAYLLRDAAPKVILTVQALRAGLPAMAAEVIELDVDWKEIARRPSGNLDARQLGLSSRHLAYVIYTSGSTGEPKGVAIEHGNTVNLLCWARSVMAWEVFERTLHSTSLNFDLSVYECFVPLSSGGCIQLVENALALLDSAGEATLINTVPSALQAVLDCGRLPNSTRVVNLAGEVLKEELVERLWERSQVEQVCNLYGPSETTTYSTWISMSRHSGFLATIGRPIANTQLYLLDASRQLVPIGVVGEIYIGGAGVARGYLGRPQLTAERFMADPFSAEPRARMYKTGDLGRWRADGTVEYLGRNDHQVKLRGFRIELGEIEAQLIRHAGVKEAVVVAREEAPGEKRLVAYLTKRHGGEEGELLAEDLRAHLKAALPEHMVPGVFVTLERLPLLPNGKLDRGALPAPQAGACTTRQYEAPQGEVEELLAQIWQSLLRVERVGRQDNFFALGGHSLLATQVTVRIRDSFSIEVSTSELFEFATLQELSARVEALGEARLHARIAAGGDEIAKLLERVVALPESEVDELVRELTIRGRL